MSYYLPVISIYYGHSIQVCCIAIDLFSSICAGVKSPLFRLTLNIKEGALMTIKNTRCRDIGAAVSRAKSAYDIGKLSSYKPLAVSGADEVKATCTTSWGPAMRR